MYFCHQTGGVWIDGQTVLHMVLACAPILHSQISLCTIVQSFVENVSKIPKNVYLNSFIFSIVFNLYSYQYCHVTLLSLLVLTHHIIHGTGI
jgi:hypothetical protein